MLGDAGISAVFGHNRFVLQIGDLSWTQEGTRHRQPPVAAATSELLIPGWVKLGPGVLVAELKGPSLPITASALTVLFLETYWPKPSISLRLSRGVTLETTVTIRCQDQYHNMRFLLYKDGSPTTQQEVELAGLVAEFPIHFMSQRDAGSYRCRCRSKQSSYCSQLSDPVVLELVDLSYPKPSISLRPSEGFAPGGAVTIQCRCRSGGGRVLLRKAGDPAAQRAMDPTGDVAEFRIRNLSRTDAGNYSCQCGARGDPNIWSEPSDPVELVVAADAHLNPKAGPDPAGTQQEDPPMTATQSEADPREHLDFTHGNISRLGLVAMVLLILGLILAYCSCPRGALR
ncbi:T-cell-interacting, activating receptor on myeloid cells protein 1-like [Pelodiscus sinensis]|uniref:T-cell-interacting, activating receptor on myeloid cells protein 1-like n=1 Tax=Pelodiscus sinensis TaxID=13735 RepID=UPI003F6C560A